MNHIPAQYDAAAVPLEATAIVAVPRVFGPGIYGDIPEDEYHASPGVSVSRLKRFAEAPAKALVARPETKALSAGTLIHCAVLEPHAVEARFLVSDLERFDPRTKEYKAEVERAQGRALVKRKDFEEALRLRDAVWGHSIARELLAPGLLVEQSAYWMDEETGLLCRGRLDGWRPEWRAIVDVKTTMDATHFSFSRDAAKYRYGWQDWMYRFGYEQASGVPVEAFLFLAVEKEPPHLLQVYELEPHAVEACGRQVRAALRDYAACQASGEWPGYPEKIEPLILPAWSLD